jgi:hypothetical protein
MRRLCLIRSAGLGQQPWPLYREMVAAARVSTRSRSLLALLIRRQLCGDRAVSAVHARLEEFLLLVAVLVIHERLLDRDRNDVEDVRRLLKDHVHLLQRPVPGLREKEVDDGEDGEVDDGEDCVGVVFDGLEGHWSDHNDHEVEDPAKRKGSSQYGVSNI